MSISTARHNSGRRIVASAVALIATTLIGVSAASAAANPTRDYVAVDTDALSSGDRADFIDDIEANVGSLVSGKGDWFCPSGDTTCVNALNADGVTVQVDDVSGEADFDAWIEFRNSKTGAYLSLSSVSPLIDIADEVDDTAAAGSYTVSIGTVRYARSTTINGSPATPDGYDLPKWTDKGDALDSAVDFMLCESGHHSGQDDIDTDVGGGLEVVMDPTSGCPGCYTLN